MERYFAHERLLADPLAAEVARWLVQEARFPHGAASLKDQAVRAAPSVALNVAEGRARGGDAGRNHYRVALGSAAEACAALDLMAVPGGAEQQEKLRRVGALIRGLVG
jgi:four helix bundle protein